METIEIVACTDHLFVMPAGVMIHSVCKNNKDQAVRFHIFIDESVTEEDKADLMEIAKGYVMKFYYVDRQIFSKMPLIQKITHAAYYRLLIPQILPDDICKALYLDCDLIVRHSLLPLWETDLNGYALAAVIDNLDSVISTYNRLKYPPHLGYFNSGVLLLNLKYWRTHNIYGEIRSYIKNNFKDILFCDQDILNYVLRERKKLLPLKYNFQTAFFYTIDYCGYDYWKYEKEVLEARKDPVILHYSLGKPWKEGSIHPYRSTFISYQNETKWKGCIWKTPKRPFMVKVRSRLKNIMIAIGLIKVASTSKEVKLFVDGLSPID